MTETHRAATLLVERSIVRRPLGVLHVQLSAGCERLARPTVPGRQHAVKHVDTSCYCFDEIFWRADAHQITRRISGHQRDYSIDNVPHYCLLFPDTQSTNRISIKPNFLDSFETLSSQIMMGCSLNDSEQRLRTA